MAVSTAQIGDIRITTQVVPGSEAKASVPGEALPGLGALPSLRKLVHAKALSPVLILIGFMQLSVGASLSFSEIKTISIVVSSGVYLWGGLAFIVTGVITVVLATKESIIRIKVCLVSHGVNAAVAALSILLYSMQLYKEFQACWVNIENRYHTNECTYLNTTAAPRNDWYGYGYGYERRDIRYVSALREAITSLILLYISVGFIISICIMILRWKALKECKYTLL